MSTRKKSFGSLHCPKSLAKGIKKSSYGKKKRKKPKKKPVKKMKRRKKPVKKRRKKPKKKTRGKPKKKKRGYVSSMIKKYMKPSNIQKVIEENPELVSKAQELRNLRNTSNYSTRELISIATLTTLGGLSVRQAENKFIQMRNSGMKTEDIFPALLEQYENAPDEDGGYYQEQPMMDYQEEPQMMDYQESPQKKPSFFSRFRRNFGKRKKRKKKKVSAALKRLCKKHKVRLTVKRGKKRVYKSEKVLKKQCKNKMKKKK